MEGMMSEQQFAEQQLAKALHDINLARLDACNTLASIRRAESQSLYLSSQTSEALGALKQQTLATIKAFDTLLGKQ
jgi:hypothetical protein